MFSSELFSFQGRASRSKFWLVFLLSVFVSFVVVLFTLLATPALMIMGYFSPTVASVVSILLYVLMIPMWWISIATSVKRFHDRNKSGWWYLIVLIPILGGLWLIIENGFLSGTAGANNFGNDSLLPSALSSPIAGAPSFTSVASVPSSAPSSTSTGTSAGMLIVYIVGGIILVALLGRLGWAFWQVRSDEKLTIISQTESTRDIKNLGLNGSTGSHVIDASPNRESGTIDPDAFVVTVGSSTLSTPDLCVGKDGIGTVAPLDQSKVIRDPESGVQLVRDQILLVFKNKTPRNVVDMKISSINGIMVGCLADMDDYQVMINGNPTLVQMNVIIDQLNKDPLIDSASFNTLSSNF